MDDPRIILARVVPQDGPALVAANLASIALHEPWVSPCRDLDTFAAYRAACDGERKIGLIARERTSGAIVGVVNVSEIVRGAFQSAYLGYYGMAGFEGRGLMREALALAIEECFGPLALHRLEANIQPANRRSLALVQALGFRNEGFSPRYLKIGGEWRDHERFAILAEEWAERGPMNRESVFERSGSGSGEEIRPLGNES
jgi:ribosomal-protein-alanine N-acetyltransferase